MWATAGQILLSVLTLIASPIINAFVLMVVWGWYIAPFFHVPPLDMIHAWGISLIVGLFRLPKTSQSLDEEFAKLEHPWVEMIMLAVTNPMIALLIAWIGTFWL